MNLYLVVIQVCLSLTAYGLSVPTDSEGYSEQNVNTPDPNFHIRRLGFPSNISLRYFENYILSYDARLRLASWVFEHLNAQTVKTNKNLTDQLNFKQDQSIHEKWRARDQDYKRNELNMTRGHLAAAANHQLNLRTKQNTYYLSNIAPQIGSGFNKGMWSVLEDFVRRLTSTYPDVFVVTGPLFIPQQDDLGEFVTYRVIGAGRVAVPTHFYKVILAEKTGTGNFNRWTFVVPHQKIKKGTKLDSFLANVTDVERSAGLLFFNKIAPNRIQTRNNTKSVSLLYESD